jgi:hypothetical protein
MKILQELLGFPVTQQSRKKMSTMNFLCIQDAIWSSEKPSGLKFGAVSPKPGCLLVL